MKNLVKHFLGFQYFETLQHHKVGIPNLDANFIGVQHLWNIHSILACLQQLRFNSATLLRIYLMHSDDVSHVFIFGSTMPLYSALIRDSWATGFNLS